MADDATQAGEEKLLKEPKVEELEKKLAECERQRDEYLAGWQRAKADFLNYKKEELARLDDVAKYTNEDMMRELIAVLDSFDLGIAALEKQGEVEKGIYMIRVQIEDALKKRGLEKIRVKVGELCNLKECEIVGEIESNLPRGAVVQEIESGYRLYEKVLRPARVIVSKGEDKATS